MNGFKFDKVPNRVRVTGDAKGTYAETLIGQIGRVIHADSDCTVMLIQLDNGFRFHVDEKYLEEV